MVTGWREQINAHFKSLLILFSGERLLRGSVFEVTWPQPGSTLSESMSGLVWFFPNSSSIRATQSLHGKNRRFALEIVGQERVLNDLGLF